MNTWKVGLSLLILFLLGVVATCSVFILIDFHTGDDWLAWVLMGVGGIATVGIGFVAKKLIDA